MTRRFGLKLAPQWTTIDGLRSVWRVADESDFDTCWVFDHFASIIDDPTGPVFEGWTLLAAMAATTNRVRVGCMVTGNTYRHPGLLAKMAVTVDHLSNGRLEMGMGAGWAEREHTMLDLPFHTVRERIERLAEACQVLRAMWSPGDEADFDGRFYTLTKALHNPRPVQQPGPPIWIGGVGERRTLRVVAEHADAWNAPGGEPSELGRLNGVLNEHCAAVGRDPASIRRTVQVRISTATTYDEVAERVEALAAVGFAEFILTMGPDNAETVATTAAGWIPRLR